MNRNIWMWISITAVALFGAILLIVNLLSPQGDGDEPEERSFCENHPNALYCTNEEATAQEIAIDMFHTLQDNFDGEYGATFCDDYFYGNIRDYCKQSKLLLLPENFNIVNRNFDVVEISDGIYDFYTTFVTGNDAYVFRIAVVDVEQGPYQISGLSYYPTPPLVDLELSFEDVNTFMVAMIQASDDNADDFCETYFTEDALLACETDRSSVALDSGVWHSFEAIKITTNNYIYTVRSEDDLTTHQYRVVFVREFGQLYASSIEITDLSD